MKRLAAAIILLVIVFVLTASTRRVFRKEISSLSEKIVDVMDACEYGTEDELSEAIGQLQNQWYKSGKVLHTMVPHGEMDGTEQNITALGELIEYIDRETVCEKCIEALNEVKNLRESEKISIENIF